MVFPLTELELPGADVQSLSLIDEPWKTRLGRASESGGAAGRII
jgi:hypothetical protein